MNVLLTGGAGYVGSVCAEVLAGQGYKLVVVDSLVEGHRAALPPEAKFFQCDLLDVSALDRAFEAERIDAVMHFAAEALVEKSVREPSIFYRTNVAGGIQLLDAMLRHDVKKIVFSSTAATYGEPKQVPIPEDHPKAPINPYGQTKWIFENILADYARYAGMKHVALRYFNAAGASELRGEAHRKETHLIPCILEAAAGQRARFDIYGHDYPTPDGTCCATTFTWWISPRRTSWRSRRWTAWAARPSMWATTAAIRISKCSRPPGASPEGLFPRVSRLGAPATRRFWSPARKSSAAYSAGRRNFPSLETIVQSAWDWKQKHPSGYPEENSGAASR